MKTIALFVLTALAEIVGCYLPYLWLERGGAVWVVSSAPAHLIADVDGAFGPLS